MSLAGKLAAAEAAVVQAQNELDALRDEVASQRRASPASVARLDGATATVDEVLAILRRDGVCSLENLAALETMDQLTHELEQLQPFAYRGEPGSFAGSGTIRNGSYLVAACPTAQELYMHPLLTETAQGLLGQYGRRLAAAVASEIRVEGSSPAQVLHRDDEEWPLDLVALKKPGAELELECMVFSTFPFLHMFDRKRAENAELTPVWCSVNRKFRDCLLDSGR